MTTKVATILVVDDDPDFLLYEQTQLESLGHQTVTASSRSAAEEILAKLRPDLAILDLMMDDLDAGFTLCHRVKQRYPDVPVIMVTGVTAETGIELDAVTAGEKSWLKADAVLAKPVRSEQLDREIRRLLKR